MALADPGYLGMRTRNESAVEFCPCRPEEIEAEIAAYLIRERNEFNHFRFVFETRDERRTVVPVIAVSLHSEVIVTAVSQYKGPALLRP